MVQLPALNTPQFNWVKSRLPRKPQPVPPIYQPEVAAEAIYWAAHHDRREWFVGGSTAIVIEGNKLLPGVGDWYLARQGYQSQQYDGAVSPDRQHNLYEAVDDEQDFGAHGDFNDRSKTASYFSELDRRREWIALAGLTGAVLAGLSGGIARSLQGGLAGISLGVLGAIACGSNVSHRSRNKKGPRHEMANAS